MLFPHYPLITLNTLFALLVGIRRVEFDRRLPGVGRRKEEHGHRTVVQRHEKGRRRTQGRRDVEEDPRKLKEWGFLHD